MRQAAPAERRATAAAGLTRRAAQGVLLALLTTSCATSPLPPADLEAPGWQVRHGQAVWRPRRDAAELAGELLVATHPDGDFVVNFSKPPLDLVVARRSGTRWQIDYPLEARRLAGHGAPPARLLWLHLADALSGRPTRPPVTFEPSARRTWRLSNPKTGESIEGFLTP